MKMDAVRSYTPSVNFTKLHGVITQKTINIIFTNAKTSNRA